MTAKKTATGKNTEVDVVDLPPVELDEIPEDPADAVFNQISEFEDTLPDRSHDWRKGDPAPEWMGPRPVWAEDHYDRGERFCPNECFWQSCDIELPAMFMYGKKSQDNNRRILGAYRVFLRQGMNDRDPHVHINIQPSMRPDNPEGSKFHLKLTLAEVDDLVATLELLSDIAKKAIVADGDIAAVTR